MTGSDSVEPTDEERGDIHNEILTDLNKYMSANVASAFLEALISGDISYVIIDY